MDFEEGVGFLYMNMGWWARRWQTQNMLKETDYKKCVFKNWQKKRKEGDGALKELSNSRNVF